MAVGWPSYGYSKEERTAHSHGLKQHWACLLSKWQVAEGAWVGSGWVGWILVVCVHCMPTEKQTSPTTNHKQQPPTGVARTSTDVGDVVFANQAPQYGRSGESGRRFLMVRAVKGGEVVSCVV
jgi:hypothetical protein